MKETLPSLGARVLMAFGLGFGLPLLAISLLAYLTQLTLVRSFARHREVISRVAGVVLVAWVRST